MSLDKMFDDVRQATGRLSDYETKTDTLLSRVATIQTRLAAMKQVRLCIRLICRTLSLPLWFFWLFTLVPKCDGFA